MPDVSVILCTRNRADVLRRTLDRFDFYELATLEGELVLVDNGSTDATLSVMRAVQERNAASIRVITEPQPGLGRARNAGLAVATGRLLVFTDDDCYLAPGYLHTLRHVFAEGTFQYGGSRVVPFDPTDAPVGCRDRTTYEFIPPHSFVKPGQFLGLVAHRDVVERIEGFDPMFGAGTPFRCEDLDFCARASLAGFTGAHVPDLLVYHHHRHKPGRGLWALARADAIARGAYYAKFIAQGHPQLIRGVLHIKLGYPYLLLTLAKPMRTIFEIYGALRYLLNVKLKQNGEPVASMVPKL